MGCRFPGAPPPCIVICLQCPPHRGPMCGFTGFIDPALPGAHSADDVLRRMSDTLAHRGPDQEGVWSDADLGVFLGFRRLAIQDLSEAGHQPMASAHGRFHMVFNGEVYNFGELREELLALGFRFRGHSDTEVMLAAFEAWGVETTVPRLRGMFAFAAWDTRDHVLWLARDRMGIKPLFIARRGPALVFGSELRAMIANPRIEPKGDPDAAWHYLRTLYVPAPLSMIAGVEKVLPGTLLRFSVTADGVEQRHEQRFWDLEEVARGPVMDRTPDEAVDELQRLLAEAVKLRLVADVPIGALLSGGVDSSLIVALMAEQMSQPVRTFTIRFDDPRFDEGPIAAEVAERLGAHHTEIAMPTSRVRDLIPDLGRILDEPMANPSLLPTLLVCQVAREDVTVALSGDGGDELFGGYNRYIQGPRLIGKADGVPQALRPLAARLLRAGVGSAGIEALGRRLQPGSLGEQHSFAARLQRAAGIMGAPDARSAYLELMAVGHPSPPTIVGAESPLVDSKAFDRHDGSLYARMALLDQLEYLPDDLLAKVDRASMWASLEARVPLLDHEVVAFSWTLPDTLKVHEDGTKWPLRRLVERYLPAELMTRPKMGFTVPIEGWLREDLSDWMGDRLHPDGLARRGLYDLDAVADLRSRFDAGRGDLALPLWTLAVLEDWADRRAITFG